MHDLRIPPGPGAPAGIVIPASELTEQFSRSSGPGGQGVNTTDSRVQLTWDLANSSAITEFQRERLSDRLQGRITGGSLTVDASEHRSQRHNRKAARERLAEIVRHALVPHIPRRATKPTRGSQRRRLQSKKRRAEIKQNRRSPRLDG